jgi:hypothetical protein
LDAWQGFVIAMAPNGFVQRASVRTGLTVIEGQTRSPPRSKNSEKGQGKIQSLVREDMNMSTRTTQSIVHFFAPFALRGVDEVQPPGDYAIDQDEDLIDGASWLAYRRVATFIHLPAVSTNKMTAQLVEIDPSELEAALKQDHEQDR